MRFLGNILWFLLGGLVISILYFVIGLLYCLTIVGIPFGYQLWKFGVFSLWPFGTEVVDGKSAGGCMSVFHLAYSILKWYDFPLCHLESRLNP